MSHFLRFLEAIKSHKNEIGLGFVATILSLILVVLVTEITFQKSDPFSDVDKGYIQFDPKLGWSPIPNRSVTINGVTYKNNSHGFRSEEVHPDKDHILVIGDSVGYGWGVENNETVTHYLDSNLKKHNKNYQVLNLGVDGYGIDQYYLRLKKYVKRIRPKIVIIVLTTKNDFIDTIVNHREGKSKPLFNFIDGKLVNTEEVISRFSCYNLLSSSYLVARFNLWGWLDSFCDHRSLFYSNNDIVRGSAAEVVVELLKKTRRLIERHHGRLLYVISPTDLEILIYSCVNRTHYCFFSIGTKYKKLLAIIFDAERKKNPANYVKSADLRFSAHVSHLKFFRKVMVEKDFNFIDHFSEISDSNLKLSEVFIDDCHYRPKGNEFLADTIEQYIKEAGWIRNIVGS